MKRISAATIIFLGCLMPTPALANHERSRCYEGEYCGDQEYDQWNSEQNNHNRRNRGAFSPGPFDDSPVTIGPICMPNSTCNFEPNPKQKEQPRPSSS